MTHTRLTSWFIMLTAFIGLAVPASAQQNFPDILEGIFKTDKPSAPYGGVGNAIYIENIPLVVTFDARADLLPPEATLIVTAIAPPPPNVRRAKPLVMGETRLLISRLAPPLQMVVAVPSDMARELDYAQIEARIVDANGITTHRMRDSVEYSGGEAPFLNLVPEGAIISAPNTPQSPAPIYNPAGGDTINGQVHLNGNAQIMRGAKLIVRVTENTLAGGVNGNIVSEQTIDIDQKPAPFSFSTILPRTNGRTLDNPEIEAWIEDWAGRKTHVMRAPTPFSTQAVNGSIPVTLYLDSMVTGSQAVPENVPYIPPASVMRAISGEAKVNAPRGLPSGATLIVELLDPVDMNTAIEQTSVRLDGLSGDIPFNMSVEGSQIDMRRAAPLVRARIDDREGKTLLTSTSLVTLGDGPVAIDLQPTAVY